MTATDLKRLRELAERATPGPWMAINHQKHLGDHNVEQAWWSVDSKGGRIADIERHKAANAAFIAAANPQTVIALLDDLAAAHKQAENRISLLEGNLAGLLALEDLRPTLAAERDAAREQAQWRAGRIAELEQENEGLRMERDSYANSDFERQLDEARSQLAMAAAERDAALRELERWRHGNTIEGDFVCPNEVALAEMTRARDELAEIAEAATFVIDNVLCEWCRRSVRNVDVDDIDRLRAVGKE